MRRFFVSLPLLFFVASIASANDDPIGTGLQLYQACAKKSGRDMELVCLGYIKGFWQGKEMMEGFSGAKGKNRMFCPPDDAANMVLTQKVMILVRYAETHPEVLHEFAAVVTAKAFMEAFPCAN